MTDQTQSALLISLKDSDFWPADMSLNKWADLVCDELRRLDAENQRLQALLAKLQPAQEPAQAGELPGYSRLIKAASELIVHTFLPSYIVDDYPHKTMSRSKIARMMEQPHDKLRLLGIEVSEGAKQMRAALAARKPLSNAQSQLEALEDLIEDLSEWSRHVIEDTAPATLEKHVREVLKRHGINGLEVKT